jgi:hypothetical protein
LALIILLTVGSGWGVENVASCHAAEDAVLEVPARSLPISLTIDLPEGDFAPGLKPGQPVRLVEVGHEARAFAADLLPGIAPDGTATERPRLAVVIPPAEASQSPRRFRLAKDEGDRASVFRAEELDGTTVKITEGDRPVLAYNFGTIVRDDLPPSEHRRARACYVHPVWGPHGEVLTDDFPKDHFHHHGIFWAWPHVDLPDDGRGPYSLWAGPGIRQRFTKWIARPMGHAAGLLAVENGWHVDQPRQGEGEGDTADHDKPVMLERVWIQPYRSIDGNRAIDIRLVFIPNGQPVTLWGAAGKSYGGLTMRLIGLPHNDQVVTIPSGASDADHKMTPLPWADFSRHFQGAPNRTGATIMIARTHPDYPPTWLTRRYGAMCVGWPGVEKRTFPPGRPVVLDYRVWVHDGQLPPEALAKAYEAYTATTEARWR